MHDAVHVLRDLESVAEPQHGVVALTDAGRLRLTRAALSEHMRRHAWRRPHPGVGVAPGYPPTFEQAVMIAIKAARTHRILVARRAAARLWDMRRAVPDVIELLAPADRHDPPLPTLRLDVAGKAEPVTVSVSRSRTLLTGHATTLGTIPLTTPARTSVDLAGVLTVNELRSTVIDARQRGVLELSEIATLHETIRKYPGRGRMRRVLADLDEDVCDSRLEWEFRTEARRRGFRPYPRPFPFRCSDGVTVHIDVAFPEAWVAVEVDGFGAHSERASLVTDHLRQNRAVADGWRPFRVDWTRLKTDAHRLFAELTALLQSPHGQSGPAPLAS